MALAYGDVPGGKPVYDPRKDAFPLSAEERMREIAREEAKKAVDAFILAHRNDPSLLS